MTRLGRPLRAGTKQTARIDMVLTPEARWWWEHVAEHSGLSRSEWIKMLADKAIGEHKCPECDAKEDW